MRKITLTKPYKDKIYNIKIEIDSYLQRSGNSIYVAQKSLPFYERMRSFIKSYKQEFGITLTLEEVYELAGHPYNKDYGTMKYIKSQAELVAKDGFIDDLKDRSVGSAYTKLRVMANSRDISIYDFAVLMTGYRFSYAIVKADYLEFLKAELLNAYPNRDVSGIKRDNAELYEKVRHALKYLPDFSSTAQLLEHLGFDIDRKPQIKSSLIDEKEICKQLLQLYPDKKITNLTTRAKLIYRSIVILARNKGQHIGEWLKERGFDHTQKTDAPRLAQVKVDEEKRYKLLISMRNEYLKQYEYDNATDIEKFKIDLAIAEQISKDLTQSKQETNTNLI